MAVVKSQILAGMPITAWIPNKLLEYMKASKAPDVIAGNSKWVVTRKKVLYLEAPQTVEASSSSGLICLMTHTVIKNTKGI